MTLLAEEKDMWVDKGCAGKCQQSIFLNIWSAGCGSEPKGPLAVEGSWDVRVSTLPAFYTPRLEHYINFQTSINVKEIFQDLERYTKPATGGGGEGTEWDWKNKIYWIELLVGHTSGSELFQIYQFTMFVMSMYLNDAGAEHLIG